MVGMRACALCLRRETFASAALCRRCREAVLRRGQITLLEPDLPVVSFFPYRFQPVRELIVAAKIQMDPHAQSLLLALWDHAMKRFLKHQSHLDSMACVGIPRPWLRSISKGSGLIPHFMESPCLRPFPRLRPLNVKILA